MGFPYYVWIEWVDDEVLEVEMVSPAIHKQMQQNTSVWGCTYLRATWSRQMSSSGYHEPVLLDKVMEYLHVMPGGVYADCTVGQGGHTSILLQKSSPNGVVLGIDKDQDSLVEAQNRLSSYVNTFIPVQGNYADLNQIAIANGIITFDGILLDLGFSSKQIDGVGYGMSFQRDEYLDMRFDKTPGTITAADIINTYSEKELADLIYTYGEESKSRRLARAIVGRRPISTTKELADVITIASPRNTRIHPATQTFQALRIAVNDELESIRTGLESSVGLLRELGRLAVISYHSLEDRLVKGIFNREASACICLPEMYECSCNHQPTIKVVNRKVIRPSESEISRNPRSRSARMRVVERLQT